MKALQHLSRLADQHNAERHHYVPTSYLPRSKYTDQDAKGLTQCIIDWFILNNHFVSSISSTCNYQINNQRFSSSYRHIVLPKLFAVVDGRAVFIEVNHRKEQLSHIQLRTINHLERYGACICIASSFQEFYDWFNVEFIIKPFEYDPSK